jgi:hypothetical protein
MISVEGEEVALKSVIKTGAAKGAVERWLLEAR